MTNRKMGWLAACILLISVVLTPYASKHPDGLIRVAKDHGFAHTQKPALLHSMFSGYSIPFVSSYWSGVLSGVLGGVVVAMVLYLLLRVVFYAKRS
jgi:tetrahydromethanopterin S-methyltransferase subunit D